MFKTNNATKIAVIGDVHGSYETLKDLIAKIPKTHTIVFAGDLIDRGKRSKDVISLIKDNYLSVMGNHDAMMVTETEPYLWKRRMSLWLQNGGEKTLRSYGGKWKIQNELENKRIFMQHRNWLRELPLIIKFPNIKINNQEVYLSHAPLNIAMQISQTTEILERALKSSNIEEALFLRMPGISTLVDSILWTRFINSPEEIENSGFFNVTGHNTTKEPFIGEHFACIDTGGQGKFTALLLPELKTIESKLIEDTWEFKK